MNAGTSGMISTQSGLFAGWVLYLQKGKPGSTTMLSVDGKVVIDLK